MNSSPSSTPITSTTIRYLTVTDRVESGGGGTGMGGRRGEDARTAATPREGVVSWRASLGATRARIVDDSPTGAKHNTSPRADPLGTASVRTPSATPNAAVQGRHRRGPWWRADGPAVAPGRSRPCARDAARRRPGVPFAPCPHLVRSPPATL